jgi:hypothetical protein
MIARHRLSARLSAAIVMLVCCVATGQVHAGEGTAAEPEPVSASVAAEAALPPLTILPGRQGYAHDNPPVLIRQRLFGLAHGVSMLAAACLDLPEHSLPIQDAYAAWHEKQAGAIEVLIKALAHHYFGERESEADWMTIVRAMNLKDSILPSLGNVPLADACATLPEALTKPRYDFTTLLAEADKPPAATPPNAATPKAVTDK